MLHFDVAMSQARLRRIPWSARYWLSSFLMSACLVVMPRGRYREALKLALHDLKVRVAREVAAHARFQAENPFKLTDAEQITIEALREFAPKTPQPELLRTAAKMIQEYEVVTGCLFDVLVRARDGEAAAMQVAIDMTYELRRPDYVRTDLGVIRKRLYV